jgi:Tfp pilus assembly pilus retraction ATPase PilT
MNTAVSKCDKCPSKDPSKYLKDVFKPSLRAVLREIQPFNIRSFRNKMQQSLRNIEKLEGKHVIMVFGHTGSGKSTSI